MDYRHSEFIQKTNPWLVALDWAFKAVSTPVSGDDFARIKAGNRA